MARGVLNSETEFHIFSLHLMMAKLAVHNRAVKVFSYAKAVSCNFSTDLYSPECEVKEGKM